MSEEAIDVARVTVIDFRSRAARPGSAALLGGARRMLAVVAAEIESLHVEAADVAPGDWVAIVPGEPAFKVTAMHTAAWLDEEAGEMRFMIELHGRRPGGRPGEWHEVTEHCTADQYVRITRAFRMGEG